ALALATLVFATPLTFYGATFWEHTPATLLLFAGAVIVALPPCAPRRVVLIAAGAGIGAAPWLGAGAWCLGVALAVLAALRCVHEREPGWLWVPAAELVVAGAEL